MENGLTIPTSTAPSVLSFVNSTLSGEGISTLLVLILSVLLAVVVLEILANAIRPHK